MRMLRFEADALTGRLLVFALAATFLLLTACNAPGPTSTPDSTGPSTPAGAATPEQVAQMPLEPNVVSIATYYTPYNPWLWTPDRSRVRGIIINAFYLGGPKNLGVFGDGVIRPTMYLLDTSQQSKQPPRLLKEWSFDPNQAMPFRAKKQTAMGWGYGRLPLVWGDELDLGGKEIRITVSFERRDGAIVHSGKKDFRVPPSQR